jgi:NADH-quinone oxidoreductase subunit B
MGIVERGRLPRQITSVMAWGRAWSLWVLEDAALCCAPEIGAALHSPRYAADRLGIRSAPAPSRADVLLLAGPCTIGSRRRVRELYEAMPRPSYVMAAGACAISGGPFVGGPTVVGGVDDVVPVDVYVPGCPPRPEAVLHGLGELQKLITAEDPAARWKSGV